MEVDQCRVQSLRFYHGSYFGIKQEFIYDGEYLYYQKGEYFMLDLHDLKRVYSDQDDEGFLLVMKRSISEGEITPFMHKVHQLGIFKIVKKEPLTILDGLETSFTITYQNNSVKTYDLGFINYLYEKDKNTPVDKLIQLLKDLLA